MGVEEAEEPPPPPWGVAVGVEVADEPPPPSSPPPPAWVAAAADGEALPEADADALDVGWGLCAGHVYAKSPHGFSLPFSGMNVLRLPRL